MTIETRLFLRTKDRHVFSIIIDLFALLNASSRYPDLIHSELTINGSDYFLNVVLHKSDYNNVQTIRNAWTKKVSEFDHYKERAYEDFYVNIVCRD